MPDRPHAMTDVQVDDGERVRQIREAYLDGFMDSGEGHNGEYPFDGERDDPRLQELADEYLSDRGLTPPQKGDG